MAKQASVLESLSNSIRLSTTIPEAEKAELGNQVQQATNEAYKKDRWFYRAVLIILALAFALSLILAVVGPVALQNALVALASLALGAIGGVLAPSPLNT